MAKRSNTAHGDARGEKYAPAPADHSPAGRLETVRLLLDEGRSREAESILGALIKSARDDANLLARARAALSDALMLEGRFADALGAIAVYESTEARRRLDPETDIDLRAHLGLAFNYTGDYPKAIAVLNAALARRARAGGGRAARRHLRRAGARLPQHQRVPHRARLHRARARLLPPRGRLARPRRELHRARARGHLPGQLRVGPRALRAGDQAHRRPPRAVPAGEDLRQHGRRLLVPQAPARRHPPP